MTKYRCVIDVQVNGHQPSKFADLLVRVLTAPLQMLVNQCVIDVYKVDVDEKVGD